MENKITSAANSSNPVILLIAGLSLVVMLMLNIWTLGRTHLDVVHEKADLTIVNQVLSEKVQDVVPLAIESINNEDSLNKVIARQDSVISYLRQSLTIKSQQLEDERLNNVTNPYNTLPYEFSPIDLSVPSTEGVEGR